MTEAQRPTEYPPVAVDLRDPFFAAFLAWLIPGLGHLYQRRYGKGGLFMTCILGTFFFGLYLGNGKVVYASWTETDKRYAYICQVGVGLPALPALIQTMRVRGGREPLFSGFMAPPAENGPDDLADRHLELGRYFELGTVYTMIAGLLNVLAIYDAACGPVFLSTKEEEPAEGENKKSPPSG